jgi:hypothetical protein
MSPPRVAVTLCFSRSAFFPALLFTPSQRETSVFASHFVGAGVGSRHCAVEQDVMSVLVHVAHTEGGGTATVAEDCFVASLAEGMLVVAVCERVGQKRRRLACLRVYRT